MRYGRMRYGCMARSTFNNNRTRQRVHKRGSGHADGGRDEAYDSRCALLASGCLLLFFAWFSPRFRRCSDNALPLRKQELRVHLVLRGRVFGRGDVPRRGGPRGGPGHERRCGIQPRLDLSLQRPAELRQLHGGLRLPLPLCQSVAHETGLRQRRAG